MQKFLLLIAAAVVLFSCKKAHVVPKPEALISKNKMIDVLYDLQLLNAAKGSTPEMIEENEILPKAYLYKKHGIDSLQFVESSLYYASKMEEMIAIYEAVNQRLERKKTKLEEERKAATATGDSLKKIAKKLRVESPVKKITKENKPPEPKRPSQ